MRKLNSKRSYKLLWDSGGETQSMIVSIDDIFEKDEHENDYEYNYALQDRIDDLLEMKEGETISFQFNRDDETELGIVRRIK